MRVIVDGVSKSFTSRNGVIPVLDKVFISTAEREFLCILGPSGCGKTTLLRIIAGLTQPTSGKVIFEGVENGGRQPLSLVFQEKGVFPWMNVIDNICFGLEMQGISKQDRYAMASPLIDKLGLNKFAKYYPHQLSVGMKQRVGIARALVSRAEMLLMDEPFSALDAQMRYISQEKLLEVCSEYRKSVIYITHDIDEALLLADRIILLTSRPAKVKEEIIVPLARPRDVFAQRDQGYLELKRSIWAFLQGEVEKRPDIE
jgi:NitT/TauT family transport system ATP-binding protein